MRTRAQDAIIEALAAQHGTAKVLPVDRSASVLACGWDDDTFDMSEALPRQGSPVGPWFYVPSEPGARRVPADRRLRYATDREIAEAHENDAVRCLLVAAGFRP